MIMDCHLLFLLLAVLVSSNAEIHTPPNRIRVHHLGTSSRAGFRPTHDTPFPHSQASHHDNSAGIHRTKEGDNVAEPTLFRGDVEKVASSTKKALNKKISDHHDSTENAEKQLGGLSVFLQAPRTEFRDVHRVLPTVHGNNAPSLISKHPHTVTPGHPQISVSSRHGNHPHTVTPGHPQISVSPRHDSHVAPHAQTSHGISYGKPTSVSPRHDSHVAPHAQASHGTSYGKPTSVPIVPHKDSTPSYGKPHTQDHLIGGIPPLRPLPVTFGHQSLGGSFPSYGQPHQPAHPLTSGHLVTPVPPVVSEYDTPVQIPSYVQPRPYSYASPEGNSLSDYHDDVPQPSLSYLPPNVDVSTSSARISSRPKALHLENNFALRPIPVVNGYSVPIVTSLEPPRFIPLQALFPVETYAPAYPVVAEPAIPATIPGKSQYHSQDDLGQYAFGYKTDESSRDETRDANGHVRGSYSYIDVNGQLQTQHYVADNKGFRVQGTNLPVHVTDEH